jgi:trimeric autotransporter adhesin
VLAKHLAFRKAKERHMSRILLAVVVCAGVTACKFDQLPDVAPPAEGDLHGLWRGSNVQLTLEIGGSRERLDLSTDGGFAFERLMDVDRTYSISVTRQPDLQTCTVSDGQGTVLTNGVPRIQVECVPDFTVDVRNSLPLPQSFSPEQLHYDLNVSVVAQRISMLVTCDAPGATATLNGTAVDLNGAETSIALAPGVTSIDLDISVEGISQTYSYSVNRGASPPSQYVYAKASNAAFADQLGWAMSASGELLAIGAPGQGDGAADQSGAVYVFRRSADEWIEEAIIKPTTQGSALCGTSVAISGDTVAVGCPNEESQTGAVYIYRASGGQWAQEARLLASNWEIEDAFGMYLALDGDNLAVSAPYEDSTVADSGAIYLFHRTGTTWAEETLVRPFNVITSGECCSGLAVSGVHVAFGFRRNAALDGAVSVYVRGPSGGWGPEQAIISASNSADAKEFGKAVALYDDLLAVGAPQEAGASIGVDGNPLPQSTSHSGAVYVFRNNIGWRQEAYIKATNTGAEDFFGSSVAMNGEMLAVGADREDSITTGVDGDPLNNDAMDSGAVYLYRRSGTTWIPTTYVKASNTDPADAFGGAIALTHDTLVVGAVRESSSAQGLNGPQDNDLVQDSGAAYVLR